MATYRKRGDRWRAEISTQGVRASKTFTTKRQAQLWAKEKELEIEASTGRGIVPDKTVEDAFTRYSNEISVTKKGARWEHIRLKKLASYDIAKLKLATLQAGDIALWRDLRLRENVQPSTVRREMNLLSSVLSVARKEWHWLAHKPSEDVSKPKNSPPRERRISEDEIERTLQALGWQPHEAITQTKHLVAAYMLLALETAMRLGEICGIEENDSDFDAKSVSLEETKNADHRKVPLSKKAISLLKQIFSSSKTVTSDVASKLFARAVRKAEIENLTFHDTRHEAITKLAKKLDVLELARMVGHRDPRSLMIYYNATPAELAEKLD